MHRVARATDRILDALGRLDWLALLLGRLAVGLLFVSTGWGKVHHLGAVTAFFEGLGIPAPAFCAHLVAWTELVCGALLVVGLLVRLAAIPLVVVMIVAIATARWPELHRPLDLVGFDELTYAVVLAMIALLGPGAASVDALARRARVRPRMAPAVTHP